jgi:hypothetical protein
MLLSNCGFCKSWCSSKVILYFKGINEVFPVFYKFLTNFDKNLVKEQVS